MYEETLGGLDYVEPECHTVHETGFRTEFKTECGKVHSRVCQTSYRTVCDHGATSECKVKYSKVCSTGTEVQCSPVCTTQYATVCSPQSGYSGDTFSAPAQGYVTPESSYATPESSYAPAQECQEVNKAYNIVHCHSIIIIIPGAAANVRGQLCGGADTELCRAAPRGDGHALWTYDYVIRIFPRCVSRYQSRTAALCPRAPFVLTSRRSSAGRRLYSSHRQSRRQSATGGKMRKDDRDKIQIKYDI